MPDRIGWSAIRTDRSGSSNGTGTAGGRSEDDPGLKKLFIVLFALALIVFAGVPLLVSTGWVRGKVETSIAEGLNRPVTIGGLSWWWFSGLSVKGLSVGGGEFTVDRMDASPSLTKLLFGSKDLGAIDIEGLKLLVVKMDDGSYSIPAFEGLRDKPESKEPAGEPSRLQLSVALRRLTIEMVDERGALLGSWDCPTADLTLDTGGAKGPMQVHAVVAGLLEKADLSMSKDGLRATAIVDADLVALGRIVPVGTARRLRATVDFTKDGGRFTAVVKDASADHGLDFSPDLEGEATFAVELAGDLDAGWIRLEKPVLVHAGPLALSIAGGMKKDVGGNWDGAFTGKLSGDLPRPSGEMTASGRAEGELSVAMAGGGFDLSVGVRLHDLRFATPGSPEVREKLVTIEVKAGKPAGGAFSIGKAELRGEGVSLALLEPNEQGGRIAGSGLLNRLRPFMPDVDWDSAGRFDLSARLTRGVEGNSLDDIRLNTGFLNLTGNARFGDDGSRFSISGNGNLARLPKGLLPEKFAGEGTSPPGRSSWRWGTSPSRPRARSISVTSRWEARPVRRRRRWPSRSRRPAGRRPSPRCASPPTAPRSSWPGRSRASASTGPSTRGGICPSCRLRCCRRAPWPPGRWRCGSSSPARRGN